MTFRRLSEFVRAIRDQDTPSTAPPRERAALAAMRHFGASLVGELPSTINVAALSLAFGQRLELTELRRGAINLVHATDLHSLPGEAPRLLRAPLLIEAARPEKGERLFGDYVSLGAYQLDGQYYLVGASYPDGLRVARWSPTWAERDIEETVDYDPSPLIGGDQREHAEFIREAARFLIVLGLLLDAEASPLRPERTEFGAHKRGAGGTTTGGWAVTHVYLGQHGESAGTSRDGDGSSTTGLAEEVAVRGHLKRQRHGPGNTETKWIYIAGYQARRWISPRPSLRIVH